TGGLAELPAEHELADGFALARRQILRAKFLRKRIRVARIADRDHREGVVAGGNLEDLAGLVDIESSHHMNDQPHRMRLNHQILSSESDIVIGVAIRFVAPAKKSGHGKYQYRSLVRP